MSAGVRDGNIPSVAWLPWRESGSASVCTPSSLPSSVSLSLLPLSLLHCISIPLFSFSSARPFRPLSGHPFQFCSYLVAGQGARIGMPSVANMSTPSSANVGEDEAVTGVLNDAQRFFDLGCAALRNDSFDEAADCLSKSLEIRVQHYGELAPECATTYYKYGCALFDKLQAEADPLCETAGRSNGGSSSHPEALKGKDENNDPAEEDDEESDGEGDEGEGDKDEEEEGDLEDAWKMLEFARVIHEKHGLCTIETVDAITKLADVNCFKEDYKTCFDDYARALQMLQQLVEPDSRILAELYLSPLFVIVPPLPVFSDLSEGQTYRGHFKIALAHQLDLKPKEALGYCTNAVSICEARVQRLKQELAEAKIQQVKLPEVLEAAFGEEGKQVKLLEDERREAGQDNPEDDINGDGTRHDKDRKVAFEALDAEIKDIEESLVDLKEKADELKEMASAPSLVEALQAANPEAVASMKQLVSLAAGAPSGSSNGAFDAPSTSDAFDAPSLRGASGSTTASVTHLGVMGRGVKRAAPMAVSGESGASTAPDLPQPKKRSLDDMMTGSGLGDTQIGFGERPVGVANGTANISETKFSVHPVVQVDGVVGQGASSDIESNT